MRTSCSRARLRSGVATRSPTSATARCAPRPPGSRICGCRRSSSASTRGSRSVSTAKSSPSSRSSSRRSRTGSASASSCARALPLRTPAGRARRLPGRAPRARRARRRARPGSARARARGAPPRPGARARGGRRAPRLRLPAAPTPLVGRRLELAAVEAILRRDEVRLVTLTGPGGTGKTRLALAVAEELARRLRDGAAFVDLSSVHDAELIVPDDRPGARRSTTRTRSSSRLAATLAAARPRQPRAVAAEAAPLIARAARGRAAASRARDSARAAAAERRARVLGPAAADARGGRALRGAGGGGRLRLRARPRRRRQVAADLRAARRACRSRSSSRRRASRALAPRRSNERLDKALDVLVGGARDLPPRQQTLRATLDWSFALLDAMRSGCSHGSRSLRAASALDDARGGHRRRQRAARRARRGEPRSPARRAVHAARDDSRVRACAARPSAARSSHARRRHLARYVEVAETAWEGILAGGARRVRGDEVQDLEAATCARLRVCGGAATMRLVRWRARSLVLAVRGRFAEARAAFDERCRRGRSAVDAAALNAAATFAMHQGDTKCARELWTRRSRSTESTVTTARRPVSSPSSAASPSRRETSSWRGHVYEECAVLFRELGSPLREGSRSRTCRDRRRPSDLGVGRRYGERAIALQRELDDPLDLAVSLANLSPTVLRLRRVDRSASCSVRRSRSRRSMGYTLLLRTRSRCAELAADRRRRLARDEVCRCDRVRVRCDRRGAAGRRAACVRADAARVSVTSIPPGRRRGEVGSSSRRSRRLGRCLRREQAPDGAPAALERSGVVA